ncbi:MAG: hypothetical protein O3B01_27265 [Planctomycetota bacterium]|nr:hypothetical protein [Planctomycetota bacterium]
MRKILPARDLAGLASWADSGREGQQQGNGDQHRRRDRPVGGFGWMMTGDFISLPWFRHLQRRRQNRRETSTAFLISLTEFETWMSQPNQENLTNLAGSQAASGNGSNGDVIIKNSGWQGATNSQSGNPTLRIDCHGCITAMS